jgi:ribonucleoside-diphosphate reductase alpha chain
MVEFRNAFGKTIFEHKYQNKEGGCGTWASLADVIVDRVCGKYLHTVEMEYLKKCIREFKFIPAGRYLYYAGRPAAFFNNCFSMIAEDSREGWAELAHNHMMALMCGGGVGTYYGKIRPKGGPVRFTGGMASGPVPLMVAMDSIGQNVMQGGSRRSALYASLPWWHDDIDEFMNAKNVDGLLSHTNISVQYGAIDKDTLRRNVRLAMEFGEPGMQFDIGHVDEVGRNACTEFISAYDSDMCNLGSVNLSKVKSTSELYNICRVGAMFLTCGSLESKLPYEKCVKVREDHRKIGLGLMGLHEFLLLRGEKYGPNPTLGKYLEAYHAGANAGARMVAKSLGLPFLERTRSVAPSGTISLLAGTTSGIEPLFATSMKRRFFDKGTWKYQYIVDPVAKELYNKGISIDCMETSYDLAKDIERRLKMQAFVQKHVDMGISSTINLPAWGSKYNNEDRVDEITDLVARYAPSIRGLTFYPDGSRGGQPLTPCSWTRALANEGETFTENLKDLEASGCKGGVCGI